MQLFMFFFDLASFLFWRGLAAGSLASTIWFFAAESDKAQQRGLVDIRSYSEKMIGYNVQKKVALDRSKRKNLEEFQRVFGKPAPY